MTQEFVTLPREVVERALKALEKADRISGYRNNWAKVNSLRKALEQPQGDQQPRYLDGGSRYKVTHLKTSGHCIIGLPEELLGQWVALVDATDNKHLAGQQAPALEQPDIGIPISVPDGWKLVPAEPTQEMLAAACRDGADLNGRPVWKHTVYVQAAWRWGQMLAAAPKPPVVEQPQGGQEPDWQDLYRKEKRRAEMWIAKYEKDIGKLEVAVPVAAQPTSVAARTCANCLHNKPPFGNCDGCSQQNDDADDEGNWEPIPEPQGEQEPVAWIRGLPEEATHISAAKAKVRSGGQIDISISAFKYDDGVLMVYVTDNDNEYPGWRKAVDVFYHLNFPVIPISTHQQTPRKPLTDEQIKLISDCTFFHESWDWPLRFARAIEAAHNIK